MEAESSVLALDPGRSKCGVAVVRRDGAILYRNVISVEEMVETARTLIKTYRPCALLMGAGTGSRPLRRALEQAKVDPPITPVDESHTSEAARARFVAENPARGWQRLLPRSLRTPDRAYDDYVAVILAERWWQEAGRRD